MLHIRVMRITQSITYNSNEKFLSCMSRKYHQISSISTLTIHTHKHTHAHQLTCTSTFNSLFSTFTQTMLFCHSFSSHRFDESFFFCHFQHLFICFLFSSIYVHHYYAFLFLFYFSFFAIGFREARYWYYPWCTHNIYKMYGNYRQTFHSTTKKKKKKIQRQ